MARLEHLNQYDQNRFVQAIGWVFENAPWVAERAWKQRPFDSIEELEAALNGEIETAALDEQWALLRAQPEFGSHAKVSPVLFKEQADAGLHSLTQEEHEKLLRLQKGYRQKFGFPFVHALKDTNKSAIFDALRTRTRSGKEVEFREALDQLCRIAQFRLQDAVKDVNKVTG